MNRLNFTLTAVALGLAVAATPAFAAKDYWVDAEVANKTFNDHTKAENKRNGRKIKSPGRQVGFKKVETPAQSKSNIRPTTKKGGGAPTTKVASKTSSKPAKAGSKRPLRTAKSTTQKAGSKQIKTSARNTPAKRSTTKTSSRPRKANAAVANKTFNEHTKAANKRNGLKIKSPGRQVRFKTPKTVAQGKSVAGKTKTLRNVKYAKTASQIRSGKNVTKSLGSVGKAGLKVGAVGTVVGVGFLTSKLIEQEANDPGKTWRDLKSGNIAKSTVYDTVDLVPGGILVTSTAKIIDQEVSDPGKTMRDVNSGLNRFGAGVDRAGRDVSQALGLNGKPGNPSRLSLTPAGIGVSMTRGIKPGLSKMGTAVSGGVKNEIEKAGADINSAMNKVDGALKGIFKK